MKKLCTLAVILAVMVSGCGARKKNTNEATSHESKSTTIDSSGVTLVTNLENSSKDQTSSSNESENYTDVCLQPGDTLKVEHFGPDGKSTGSTTFTGSGKATAGTRNKQTNNKKSEKAAAAHSEVTAGNLHKTDDEDKGVSSSSSSVERAAATGFSLWWLLLIIPAALAFRWIRSRYQG